MAAPGSNAGPIPPTTQGQDIGAYDDGFYGRGKTYPPEPPPASSIAPPSGRDAHYEKGVADAAAGLPYSPPHPELVALMRERIARNEQRTRNRAEAAAERLGGTRGRRRKTKRRKTKKKAYSRRR